MEKWLEKRTCTICKGTGEVDGNFYVVANFPLIPAPPQKCWTCNGTGKVEVEVKTR